MSDGYWGDQYDEEEWANRVERFADPGGDSALHPASDENPRNLPCPTCGWPDRLTPADRARGYQCDACATATERGVDITYYERDPDVDEADVLTDEAFGSPEEVTEEVHGTAEKVEKERYQRGNRHDSNRQ